MQTLLYFVVMAAAFMGLSQTLPGFHVTGWIPALFGAVILAVVNTLVKPVLFILSLPFIIVTFGLFLLVLNACMLKLTANACDIDPKQPCEDLGDLRYHFLTHIQH